MFFFEGRQTQNSEDNIDLGDGGDMTFVVWYFMGWLVFLKKPVFQLCIVTIVLQYSYPLVI